MHTFARQNALRDPQPHAGAGDTPTLCGAGDGFKGDSVITHPWIVRLFLRGRKRYCAVNDAGLDEQRLRQRQI